MFEHLRDLEIHYEEVMAGLSDPLVTADQNRFRAMMKEQADLQPLVEAYRAYTAVCAPWRRRNWPTRENGRRHLPGG